jgi:toxin ParE1/3/4
MARMSVQLAPLAQSDLIELAGHLARTRSIESARKTLRRLRDAIASLRDFPELGRRRDDLRPGARSLAVGGCLVFYEIGARVDVLRVVDSRRDVDALPL